jgi:hypothetical protein
MMDDVDERKREREKEKVWLTGASPSPVTSPFLDESHKSHEIWAALGGRLIDGDAGVRGRPHATCGPQKR